MWFLVGCGCGLMLKSKGWPDDGEKIDDDKGMEEE